MKVKIFQDANVKNLEAEINYWLAQVGPIEIYQQTQSQSGEEDTIAVTITIRYRIIKV